MLRFQDYRILVNIAEFHEIVGGIPFVIGWHDVVWSSFQCNTKIPGHFVGHVGALPNWNSNANIVVFIADQVNKCITKYCR